MNTSIKNILIIAITIFMHISFCVVAQDDSEENDQPVRPPFESAWLLNGQTVIVPTKGTLEFDILHRFGNLSNGVKDLWGIYAPSNIRLGLTYVPIDNLAIGFGNTKDDDLLDFNIKYSIIKQTRSWSIPVSVTYFANAVFDTGEEDRVDNGTQRWSYFHEILISTRINYRLSVQVAPSFSHFNGVDSLYSNDVIAASIKARYRVASTMGVRIGYEHPFSNHQALELNPTLSAGIEISTSGHAFQIFLGNFRGIAPQLNSAFHQNSPFSEKYKDNKEGVFKENFLIGFNITKLWNF